MEEPISYFYLNSQEGNFREQRNIIRSLGKEERPEKETDIITSNTDKESQKKINQSHEGNYPPPWSPCWKEGNATCPWGCRSLGPQDHQGQKDADSGFYVTGGRGLMLFLPQFKCHTSRNSHGQLRASRQSLPITPRLPLCNIH